MILFVFLGTDKCKLKHGLPSLRDMEAEHGESSPELTVLGHKRVPRWALLRNLPSHVLLPTSTVEKSLAFALILHKRLGNQRFGRVYAHDSGWHGNELFPEIVRMILEFSMGIRYICGAYDMDGRKRELSLRQMASPTEKKLIRVEYGDHNLGYYNTPVVMAAAETDTRFMSFGGKSPSINWLAGFMDLAKMPVPTVHSVPSDPFVVSITGLVKPSLEESRAIPATQQPFAGCPWATHIQRSVVLCMMKTWWTRQNMQAWWDKFWELFKNGRRFYIAGQMVSAASNFMLFHVHNPNTGSLRRNKYEPLHVAVSADVVRHWLTVIWGVHNVEMYVRVRDVKTRLDDGVQIFVFASNLVSMIEDIMHSSQFKVFDKNFQEKKPIPL